MAHKSRVVTFPNQFLSCHFHIFFIFPSVSYFTVESSTNNRQGKEEVYQVLFLCVRFPSPISQVYTYISPICVLPCVQSTPILNCYQYYHLFLLKSTSNAILFLPRARHTLTLIHGFPSSRRMYMIPPSCLLTSTW